MRAEEIYSYIIGLEGEVITLKKEIADLKQANKELKRAEEIRKVSFAEEVDRIKMGMYTSNVPEDKKVYLDDRK